MTALAACALLMLVALPAPAQRYQTNEPPTLAINSITASTASNSTTFANSGGLAPTFFEIKNPAAPFDVFVNFTCNTQVFWGASFRFSGSIDGVNPTSFGGRYNTGGNIWSQEFLLICPTNTVGVSNYTAAFRSTDTNCLAMPMSWGKYLVFHGGTNIAPTTLTINSITVAQVR